MKNKILIITLSLVCSFSLQGQTLYVPGGFSATGIGTSTSSGNVGIGTSSPGFKLDVINQAGEPQNLFRVKVNGAPTDYFNVVNATGQPAQFIPALWGHHTTDNRQALYLTGSIGTSNDLGNEPIIMFDSRISSGPALTRPLFGWDSYGNRKMTLSASGNLGIGTSIPLTKLQVMDIGSGGSSNSTVPNQGLLLSGNGTGGALNLGIDATGIFYSWIQSRDRNSTAYYNLSLNPNGGNVGIGTTNPNQKLTVNGTIYGKEVKVDLSVPGPDYVFADNYPLQPLNELKTYIDQNKHLPEVPSAAAMEANGINLGEMNMMLLKKVEELTLYVIEQNKRTEKTERENDGLKERILELEKLIKK